ncbi:methyl-accepting chemotaxis protein [Paenibacillus alginolyticus]|uniref:Methyl-accepting chemotaxis protein n=1 Tax=Paenibacillus alginolyticus TaxID=59839 RepID=A0ABT4G9V1_9BACL|nr:methyl-accepting chemotaxis protein [Paenibacillus alginolyticus]MCY9669893.1 methyl-accepting chemotaxis protein [Paenibacillus alginolyticus]MCY9692937.1 methyl-accepting chemotaxis protein [Paenibacillus alginolyticus]MEC0144322.1 methyl-accepting chemotaxis protein [Paenibacillus alginolyticus]
MLAKSSLRKQFLIRMFVVFLLIAVVSGIVQQSIISSKIADETDNQAVLASTSIQHGIKETNTASKAIEHQIDLKLIAVSKHIADRLNKTSFKDVTTEELVKLQKEFGLAGITLFARTPEKDNVVGVRSTDQKEIGFSFKEFGFLKTHEDLLDGKKPDMPNAYNAINMMVLQSAQSGSHGDVPVFFKYAYYHAPGTDYIIDPYIEANEVYKFTEEVGPASWITEVKSENPYVVEMAVLTPKVFVDPTLETTLYPPLHKIVHGDFKYMSDKDQKVLKDLATNPQKTHYIETIGGKKVYKMFLPIEGDQVTYIALDYGKLSSILYRHSAILIISGFISLLALFILSANFFSGIYRNIHKIIVQIKSLESGDFRVKSDVKSKGELQDLSVSTNHMVDTLSTVLQETNSQATKVQLMSKVLEKEANKSVDKMYTVSLEVTSQTREYAEEVMDSLEALESHLESLPKTEESSKLIGKIETIRSMTGDRSSSITDITITLADLLKSLQSQSAELSQISRSLLAQLDKFKL